MTLSELAIYANRRGTLNLCYSNTTIKVPVRVVNAEALPGDKIRLQVKQQGDDAEPIWVSRELVNIKWSAKPPKYVQIQVA